MKNTLIVWDEKKKKKQDPNKLRFTIGSLEADLNLDIIKKYKLKSALTRIGKALIKQNPEAAGIEFFNLGFCYRLDTSKEKK